MSFALFEENGDLKSGTVLADNGTSLQIELVTGRRAKVKASHVYLTFESPEADQLMPGAVDAADQIDLDFLWECAGDEEFGFEALAADYFGDQPDAVQCAALLVKLKGAPIYFQRKGRGRFKAAEADKVQAALAAVKKRQEQEALIEQHAHQMQDGQLPELVAESAAQLLVKPDKMGVAFKSFDIAVRQSGKSPEKLLLDLGAFDSEYDLHMGRFCYEFFAQGRPFPPALEKAVDGSSLAATVAELPESDVQAFSVDDSSTTEIDDAFSVTTLPSGQVRVGVHIAVPALGIANDSEADKIARDRMSTVYMPGDKIPMLPDALIRHFSLDAGKQVPALSLYLELDPTGTSVQSSYSVVERIRIADNLRDDQLDDVVTEPALLDADATMPHADELRVLWTLIQGLQAERERVRGKPEPQFRLDFSFRINDDTVQIEPRRRDSPLQRIVSELMILANSTWGGFLVEKGVAGIYRSQQAGRVRMSAQALPHEGMGVAQYIWSTSPLRRYIDLVNQRQLVAAVQGSAPPLTVSSAELFSVVPAFEARYSAYQDFQQRMEKYWCMRWLDQQPAEQWPAVVVRDELVRLEAIPLYFRADGTPAVPAGTRLFVHLAGYDRLDLSIRARFAGLDDSAQSLDHSPITSD